MKQKWTPCPFHYKRNPLISLIRDKIVLQLQLITPGSVAINEIMKPVEEYDNVKR